jgi:hypothetical protein
MMPHTGISAICSLTIQQKLPASSREVGNQADEAVGWAPPTITETRLRYRCAPKQMSFAHGRRFAQKRLKHLAGGPTLICPLVSASENFDRSRIEIKRVVTLREGEAPAEPKKRASHRLSRSFALPKPVLPNAPNAFSIRVCDCSQASSAVSALCAGLRHAPCADRKCPTLSLYVLACVHRMDKLSVGFWRDPGPTEHQFCAKIAELCPAWRTKTPCFPERCADGK